MQIPLGGICGRDALSKVILCCHSRKHPTHETPIPNYATRLTIRSRQIADAKGRYGRVYRRYQSNILMITLSCIRWKVDDLMQQCISTYSFYHLQTQSSDKANPQAFCTGLTDAPAILSGNNLAIQNSSQCVITRESQVKRILKLVEISSMMIHHSLQGVSEKTVSQITHECQ